MRKKLLYLSIISFIISVSISCTLVEKIGHNKKQYKEKNDFSRLSKEDDLDYQKDIMMKKIDNMTLKEKIGQLLIVGFRGATIDEDIEKYIEEYKVGGFIFFARNIKNIGQTFKLINDIKTINKVNDIPLFISVDEEGGRVSRFPDEFKQLPSAKVIGNINKKDVAYEYGKMIGTRLNSLGFNLDFAPVLDINSNPKNPVIGDRSFSDNEKVVSKNGINTMKGLKEEQIISAVKHFPGHGDTVTDSHKSLPIIYKTIDDLRRFELMPFEEAIKNDADAIMVAHMLYRDIDENYPSTMSKSIINGLLRDEMDFKGVVISDDMTMGAVLKNYSLEDGSIKFLEAGGDILLICHGADNPSLVFEAIEKAVEEKILTEEEIDEKVYRILKLKDKYNISDKYIKEIDIYNLNKRTEGFLNNIN